MKIKYFIQSLKDEEWVNSCRCHNRKEAEKRLIDYENIEPHVGWRIIRRFNTKINMIGKFALNGVEWSDI